MDMIIDGALEVLYDFRIPLFFTCIFGLLSDIYFERVKAFLTRRGVWPKKGTRRALRFVFYFAVAVVYVQIVLFYIAKP